MSDRLQGSSYYNPIWHGKWRIYISDYPYIHKYQFVHDDFDGAPDAYDNRYGDAKSIDDAKQQIDEMEQ